MRFRSLLVILSIVILESFLIALLLAQLGAQFEVMVQLATIAALIFPLYFWEKERLGKRAELVDQLRVWADHFYYMTVHIQQIPPNLFVEDDLKSMRNLSTVTADHLAEALARCGPMIGASSDLGKQVYDFILELRKFARKKLQPGKVGLDLTRLQSIALEIGQKASPLLNSRFKLRSIVQPFILVALAICSIVLVVLFLVRFLV